MMDFFPNRASQKNLATAFVGLGVSLLFTALYLREVEQDGREGQNGVRIGEVLRASDDVQRRPRSRLLWLPLPSQSEVFEHDTIRTGAASSATIDLGEKGRVELQPESLAVLETDNQRLRVNLASGDLFIKGDLIAEVGGSRIEASRDSEVSISRKDTDVRVESKRGTVQVISKTGDKTALAAGQALSANLENNAPAKVAPAPPLKIERLSPNDRDLVRKSTVDLAVKLPQAAPALEVEVARESGFRVKSILQRLPLNAAGQLSLSLGEGLYFWRVRELAPPRRIVSSVGQFEVRFWPQLEWRSSDFSLRSNNDGLDLSLGWSAVRFAHRYRIQISNDQGEIWSGESPTPSLEWKKKQNPLWQRLRSEVTLADHGLDLKVDALDGQGQSLVQSPLKGRLELHDERTLALPQKLSLALDAKDPLKAHFTWQPVPEADAYEVEIGSEKLEAKVSNLEVASLKIAQNPLLSVRAHSVRGLRSESARLEVKDLEPYRLGEFLSKAPQPLYPIEGSTLLSHQGKIEVSFRFKQSAQNALYHPKTFEVELSGEKGSAKTYLSSSTQLSVKDLAPGLYKWRLRSIWREGRASPFTHPLSFRVSPGAAPLVAPKIRQPAASQGFDE